MPKSAHILGMNARNQLYTGLNSSKSIAFTKSKFATKALLNNKGIPTAQIYDVFASIEDIKKFNWDCLNGNFVIKPSNGNAGKGVVAFRKRVDKQLAWISVVGIKWTIEDITLHCLDILDGQYSTYGNNHQVIVEDRVPIHRKLLKYTYKGTPDVRVIVYNHIPIMALLRLPTEKSEGRANQSQGAIGVGIDMATGVTTHAVADFDKFITYLPGSKRKLNGIKLPYWSKTLRMAVEAADAAGLTYCGIDLFLHEDRGPMVVELNANPGLSIQIPNRAGLRRRLERVEGLTVNNPDHGVRIAQALFAESFSDQIKAQEGLQIIHYREVIELFLPDKKLVKIEALVNTGRFRSAISAQLAQDTGLADLDDLLWFQSSGEEGNQPVVEVEYKLTNRKRKSAMLVTKSLNRTKHKIEFGRNDLTGLLVGEQTE